MSYLTTYGPTALAVLGGLSVIMTALGAALPGKAGAVCKTIGVDIGELLSLFGKKAEP